MIGGVSSGVWDELFAKILGVRCSASMLGRDRCIFLGFDCGSNSDWDFDESFYLTIDLYPQVLFWTCGCDWGEESSKQPRKRWYVRKGQGEFCMIFQYWTWHWSLFCGPESNQGILHFGTLLVSQSISFQMFWSNDLEFLSSQILNPSQWQLTEMITKSGSSLRFANSVSFDNELLEIHQSGNELHLFRKTVSCCDRWKRLFENLYVWMRCDSKTVRW
jgi:hypothetical protein